MTEVLRLSNISKRFGTLRANDDISLVLAAGEVLALLGENGAGKSTLVSILFGHYRADAGRIEVFGAPLPPGDPAAALAAGIGMVHQHFSLADNLSVLDNVVIGTEPWWRLRADRRGARAQLAELGRRFGLTVDADARVGTLSIGEQQRVEILKALYRGARILILDEPTAVLTPQEAARLFETLRQFVDAGLAVIFISHKLDEVMRVADRVAVLRAGRLVAQRRRDETGKAELAQLMLGREMAVSAPRPARIPVERVLELRQVANRPARGGEGLGLHDATLTVGAGEIVAVAGVAGNGQQALAQLLFGLAPAVHGEARLNGAAYPRSPRTVIVAGVARVPEDRRRQGSIGDMALWENAALEQLRTPSFARAGWLRRRAMRAFGSTLIDGFDLRGGGPDTRARQLSGGNLQKLILGRALTAPTGRGASAARLIVADQPTWGLDVGAVQAIHARLAEAADDGAAVLVISEDLDEVLGLADRIVVISRGHIVDARATADWTLAELGLAMAAMADRRAA